MEIETEIEQFLSIPCEDRQTTDPILWWHVKGQTFFPCIAEVAFKFLIIPASSIPCDRLFTIKGCTFNDKRSNLCDESARSILFLRDNL
jgi:hypothetical protein